jgi:AP-3 complex subunit mu
MAIDGLIVLEPTGKPIVQTPFRAFSSAYPLLHIDAFNSAVLAAKRLQDVDPVLYVSSYENGAPSVCCHLHHNDLHFLCPVSRDGASVFSSGSSRTRTRIDSNGIPYPADPLYAFAFLHKFIDILRDYFGDVSALALKENFDIVYQLLEETLDSGGHPLTTEPNALRDIVLPPSLISKLLNVAGMADLASGAHGAQGTGAFASPIPWRKAGVRYNANEIYFDIVESLKAVVLKYASVHYF